MPDSDQTGLARIAIDRGGTFTDAICSRPGHDDIVLKARSLDTLMSIADQPISAALC